MHGSDVCKLCFLLHPTTYIVYISHTHITHITRSECTAAMCVNFVPTPSYNIHCLHQSYTYYTYNQVRVHDSNVCELCSYSILQHTLFTSVLHILHTRSECMAAMCVNFVPTPSYNIHCLHQSYTYYTPGLSAWQQCV